MRKVLLVLAFLPLCLFGQGVLKSRIYEPRDTTYTLEVWWLNWDAGYELYAKHPFRISTVTHFTPGEYIVGYYRGDVLLYAERIHIPHSPSVWKFLVMDPRPSLDSVAFIRYKDGPERLEY